VDSLAPLERERARSRAVRASGIRTLMRDDMSDILPQTSDAVLQLIGGCARREQACAALIERRVRTSVRQIQGRECATARLKAVPFQKRELPLQVHSPAHLGPDE